MSGHAAVTVRRTTYPQVDARAGGLMRPAPRGRPARRHGGAGRAPGGSPASAGSSPPASAAPGRRRRGRRWRAPSRSVSSGRRSRRFSGTRRSSLRGRPRWRSAAGSGPDRPFLLVGTPRAPEGVVFRDQEAPAGLPLSVARELDRLQGGQRRSSGPRAPTGRRSDSRWPPWAVSSGTCCSAASTSGRTSISSSRERALAVAQAVAQRSGRKDRGAPRLPHRDRRPAGRPPGRLRDRAARVLPGGRARCPPWSGRRSRRTSGAGTSR